MFGQISIVIIIKNCVCWLCLFTSPVLILNGRRAITEALVKRSTDFASRPALPTSVQFNEKLSGAYLLSSYTVTSMKWGGGGGSLLPLPEIVKNISTKNNKIMQLPSLQNVSGNILLAFTALWDDILMIPLLREKITRVI